MTQKDLGREQIRAAVSRYQRQRGTYTRSDSSFNETQVRTDFLNDLLGALGWDVFNRSGAPQRLREVIVEEAVRVEGEANKKKPDYTLRRNGERYLFVEAKKPNVAISIERDPAFQLRRYGWSASLQASVLTNFDKLAIYDCSARPETGDVTSVARLSLYDHSEYVSRWDEIYERLSRESAYSGRFEALFSQDSTRGRNPFDQYFLKQIEGWRLRIAQSLALSAPNLSAQELAFVVQRLINRVVFLRICEDRGQETYERLRSIRTYDGLKTLFYEADRRYNSGLFNFIEDTVSLHVHIEDAILIGLFEDLYFPRSPYDFSVVDPGVLSAVYEQFLGKELTLDTARNVMFRDKPEIADSHGVVTTPNYIVEEIVTASLDKLCLGKTLEDVRNLRVADIACGSGVFLLTAYAYLLDWHVEWYTTHSPDARQEVYQTGEGEWRLALAEKHRILTQCFYGVDIDEQAVEVARFSLLLKVLDGESAAYLELQLNSSRSKALPNMDGNIVCGNSLVGDDFYTFEPAAVTDPDIALSVRPLDWVTVFPQAMQEGGFHVIIGNPPYIRIQNMVHYAPREVAYYQQAPAYQTHQGSFDKSTLFVERALSLLRPGGIVGLIVPNRFMTAQAGEPLRRILASQKRLYKLIHFGVQQVFPGRRTYTCILLAGSGSYDEFSVEHVADLDAWRNFKVSDTDTAKADVVGSVPWIFVSPTLRSLFDRVQQAPGIVPLSTLADVFVGLQTSADDVYILSPNGQSRDGLVPLLDRAGRSWQIEEKLLRPCILDVPITPFGPIQSNRQMLFPYQIVNGKAVVYTPEEMQSIFPEGWEYLSSHKERLEKRSIQGNGPDKWYRFGRSQSLTKFDGEPVVLWPVLSLVPRYTLDKQNVLFTGGGNGPYYALRVRSSAQAPLPYLLACMSHPLLELMVRSRASIFGGGYVSHGKQFVEGLPIVSPAHSRAAKQQCDKIVNLTEQCLAAARNASNEVIQARRIVFERQRDTLRRQIEQLVGEIYSLEAADQLLIAESTGLER